MNFTVYLSGTIEGLSYDEANAWRQDATDALGRVDIQTRNPLRDRLFLHPDELDAYNEELVPGEVVRRDVGDIAASDVVLMRWDRPSIGTACELWEAYRTHKPVILVSESPQILRHPWVRVCATRIFGSLPEAVQYICNRVKDMDPDGLPEMWDVGGESAP